RAVTDLEALFPRGDIPDAEGAVVAGGRQRLAVGREGESADAVVVGHPAAQRAERGRVVEGGLVVKGASDCDGTATRGHAEQVGRRAGGGAAAQFLARDCVTEQESAVVVVDEEGLSARHHDQFASAGSRAAGELLALAEQAARGGIPAEQAAVAALRQEG